jgi:hypothetical protein
MTLAYPCVHDTSPHYHPGMTPVEASQEKRMSKFLTQVSESNKRKALKVPWNNPMDVSTRKQFAERAGLKDMRTTRCDPDRVHQTPEQAMKDSRSSSYAHPKPWNGTHHIVHSRVNNTLCSLHRSYFDRYVDIPDEGDTNLIPDMKKFEQTWDLRQPGLTPEQKHQRRLEAIRKTGELVRPEKFHGGDWID